MNVCVFKEIFYCNFELFDFFFRSLGYWEGLIWLYSKYIKFYIIIELLIIKGLGNSERSLMFKIIMLLNVCIYVY